MRTRSGWNSTVLGTPEITLTVSPLLVILYVHALSQEYLPPLVDLWWHTLFVKQQPCEISKFLRRAGEGTWTKTMGGQTAKSAQKAFESEIDYDDDDDDNDDDDENDDDNNNIITKFLEYTFCEISRTHSSVQQKLSTYLI